MIVSKFKSNKDLEEFGLELVQMFSLIADKDERYQTSWGEKTAEGLARCVERMYRERIYGTEEQVPDLDLYIASPNDEEIAWPK